MPKCPNPECGKELTELGYAEMVIETGSVRLSKKGQLEWAATETFPEEPVDGKAVFGCPYCKFTIATSHLGAALFLAGITETKETNGG